MRKFQLEDSRSTLCACRRLKQDLLNENIKKTKIKKKRDKRRRNYCLRRVQRRKKEEKG
jgi:hypothetical protein